MQRTVFISYASPDLTWAKVIALHCETAGDRVILQAKDFLPGGNFVSQINSAIASSQKVVLVLSPDYFTSNWTELEWTSVLAYTLKCRTIDMIPLIVRPCIVPPLLAGVTFVDLCNLTGEALAHGLTGALGGAPTNGSTRELNRVAEFSDQELSRIICQARSFLRQNRLAAVPRSSMDGIVASIVGQDRAGLIVELLVARQFLSTDRAGGIKLGTRSIEIS